MCWAWLLALALLVGYWTTPFRSFDVKDEKALVCATVGLLVCIYDAHGCYAGILAASMDECAHWSDPCIRLIAASVAAAATKHTVWGKWLGMAYSLIYHTCVFPLYL